MESWCRCRAVALSVFGSQNPALWHIGTPRSLPSHGPLNNDSKRSNADSSRFRKLSAVALSALPTGICKSAWDGRKCRNPGCPFRKISMQDWERDVQAARPPPKPAANVFKRESLNGVCPVVIGSWSSLVFSTQTKWKFEI